MNNIFNNELTDYDKALIRILWYTWSNRIREYTDASGTTMALAINAAFLSILGNDRHMPQVTRPEVSINRSSYFVLQISDIYGNIHRVSLNEDQLEVLRIKLNDLHESTL